MFAKSTIVINGQKTVIIRKSANKAFNAMVDFIESKMYSMEINTIGINFQVDGRRIWGKGLPGVGHHTVGFCQSKKICEVFDTLCWMNPQSYTFCEKAYNTMFEGK